MRAGPRAPRSPAALLAVALLLSSAVPAPAQRKPLTDEEQRLVNQTIDLGAAFLKRTQNKAGDWPRKEPNSHAVGYTALPGLTLLECGVPADDPVVAGAAKVVRRLAPKLDATYEIALSVLFLDRLDDPRDSELIQTLATRLIAGQTVTGGWGYKCPKVGPRDQTTILTALRKLDPRPPMLGQVRRPGDQPMQGVERGRPGIDKGVAGGEPGIDGFPLGGGKGGLDKGVKPGDGKGGLSGSTREGSSPGLSPGEKGSTLEVPRRDDGRDPKDQKKDDPRADNRPAEERDRLPPRVAYRRWQGCVKETDWSPEPGDPARAEKPARVADVVPPRLRQLAIFQEGPVLMVDPAKREQEAMAATTDNSNTQFAILALWAASRHDVPMVRTMRSVVRRFTTSQNRDGSWGYYYRIGGGVKEGPAMTCVGLLGLAIGQALVEHPADQNQVDPAILRGFVAASRHVGTALDGGRVPAMVNLYLLWSIERVAVLYNLPTIADKDWYRWAAQVLVAHQQADGSWRNGGYHGAHPVIDTCLALLVLKRVNLVRDLGERLPIDPGKLDRAVAEQANPGARQNPGPPEGKEARPTTPPALPRSPGFVTTPPPPKQEPPTVSPTPPAPTAQAPAPPPEAKRGWPWWLLLLLALSALVLAGGIFCVILHLKKRPQEDEPERPRKKARPVPAKGGKH